MVSVRQKRKKKRPSRYFDSTKNSKRLGIVQEKKAAFKMIEDPNFIMSSVFTARRAIEPVKLAMKVVFQVKRGSNNIRNNTTKWSIDQRKEIFCKAGKVLTPFCDLRLP